MFLMIMNIQYSNSIRILKTTNNLHDFQQNSCAEIKNSSIGDVGYFFEINKEIF